MGKKTLFVLTLLLSGLTAPLWAQNDHYPQFMQMANTAYGSQKYELAIEYFQAAIDDNSDWWPAYVGLANCYYAQKKYKDALQNYETALKMHPDNPTLSRFLDAFRRKLNTPTPTPVPLRYQTTPLPQLPGV